MLKSYDMYNILRSFKTPSNKYTDIKVKLTMKKNTDFEQYKSNIHRVLNKYKYQYYVIKCTGGDFL